MDFFTSRKYPNVGRKMVGFDQADQSTLANICRVAAERFKDHANDFRKLIDHKPVEGEQKDDEGRIFVDMTPHGDAARRLAEQFEMQAAEAIAYARVFDAIDFIPEMAVDLDDEEEEAA